MAVILSDGEVNSFKSAICDLQTEANGLVADADQVMDVLNNGIGKQFRDSYDTGKTETDKLSDVINILIGQKKDLDKLIQDLNDYLNSAIEFGNRLNQWTT